MWANDEHFHSFTLADFQGCLTSVLLSLCRQAAGQKTCNALHNVVVTPLGQTSGPAAHWTGRRLQQTPQLKEKSITPLTFQSYISQ